MELYKELYHRYRPLAASRVDEARPVYCSLALAKDMSKPGHGRIPTYLGGGMPCTRIESGVLPAQLYRDVSAWFT